MNEARKLKHQQPSFMAVKNERDIENNGPNKQKKYWFDTSVLITWIVIAIITVLFWMFIIKLL